MAAKFSMRVDVDRLTLNRILAKLGRGNPLFGNDLRRVMDETSAEIENLARRRVPIGETRQLASSIRRRIDSGAIPLWAVVKADATNATGGKPFRYGWALQSSKKIRYTYRNGPRAGRPTRRWFTGALRGMKQKLAQRLAGVGRKVESRWQR